MARSHLFGGQVAPSPSHGTGMEIRGVRGTMLEVHATQSVGEQHLNLRDRRGLRGGNRDDGPALDPRKRRIDADVPPLGVEKGETDRGVLEEACDDVERQRHLVPDPGAVGRRNHHAISMREKDVSRLPASVIAEQKNIVPPVADANADSTGVHVQCRTGKSRGLQKMLRFIAR